MGFVNRTFPNDDSKVQKTSVEEDSSFIMYDQIRKWVFSCHSDGIIGVFDWLIREVKIIDSVNFTFDW